MARYVHIKTDKKEIFEYMLQFKYLWKTLTEGQLKAKKIMLSKEIT